MLGSAADESVGDPGEPAIEGADSVGPAGGMERRRDHRHSGPPGAQPAPEHFVTCADSDHRIDLALAHQRSEAEGNRRIPFPADQIMVNGNLGAQFFAEGPHLFEAADLGGELRAVHAAHEIHQQHLSPADRHAGDDEEDF